MEKNRWRKRFCIGIAVFFIIALLESLPCRYSISAEADAKPLSEYGEIYDAKVNCGDSSGAECTLPLAAKKLLSADRMPGIDDFHMVTKSCSPAPNIQGNIGNSVLLLLLAAVLLFFGNRIIRYWLHVSKRQTALYQVIHYIHRSDGKKKSHSDQKLSEWEVVRVEIGTKYKILSIDEEKEVQYFFKRLFLQRGYKLYTAQSGKDGIMQADNSCPDLILLDLILPDIEGIEMIRRLRSFSDCPLIIVSSKRKERDKVAALDAGADDYITKPFGPEELMARIRCALRCRRKYGSKSSYRSSGLHVDFEKRLVQIHGAPIHLTPVEYRIVEYLAANPGKVITYQMLLEKIWGPYASESNKILRVNMTNIRRKIGDNPSEPRYIFTEAGVGYRMAESTY